MSRHGIINTKVRPTVVFDASNSEHRRWGYQFLKTMSWRDCPYIFAITESHSNLYSLISYELSIWYGRKEFARAAKMNSEQKIVRIRG